MTKDPYAIGGDNDLEQRAHHGRPSEPRPQGRVANAVQNRMVSSIDRRSHPSFALVEDFAPMTEKENRFQEAMSAQDDTSTTELLAKARNGNREALAALFDSHAQRLLASVRAELGERARQRLESQDVMQEVYLDALRSIDGFVDRGSDSFLAWLRRIAVHRICDVDRRHHKTQKRRGEARMGDLGTDESMMGLLDAVTASMTTPSQAVDRTDRVQHLRHALSRLDEDHRDVIRFRYLQQLSVAETAAKMDRSDRAIRSLCVRALIRLRELLADVL